jgi:predicted acylesterase/phospholipase RssA
MSSEDKVVANDPGTRPRKFVWVGGAGGSRAILADAGALMLLYLAGIEIGDGIGISGGSIPIFALKAGVHPLKLGELAVGVDFQSLVPRHATPLHIFIAFLLRDRFEYTRPKKGVFGSENLGVYVRDLSRQLGLVEADGTPIWPKGFKTMSVVARTQIICDENRVIQALRNGQVRVLSDKPMPIDIAIRATCAVPGIIDAVPWNGRYLFDGALTWDGQCPVVLPIRHWDAKAEDIIGCDVGDEQHRFAGAFRWFWSLVCGGHCVDHEGPKTPVPDEVIMIRPNVWSVRSLQFNLTTEQKWQAVLSGFQEAAIQLARVGLLTGDAKKRAFSICMDIEKLKNLANEVE